ncbi:MAG TPA: tRNA pseudouridine(13) synthase TruD, partial [Myxococcota bacterium]
LPGFDDACVLRACPAPSAPAPVIFRGDDDGFVVDEIPAYLPCGEGEHLYLFVEKRGVSTPALIKRALDRFHLHERDVGVAGRKDERGVTRQWISLPARSVPDPTLLEGDGVRVLEHKRHKNKLRLGHLRGNRFTIRLACDPAVVDGAAARVAGGVPNIFGMQRFGPSDSTLRQAEQLLARGRPARSRKDEFLVSAAQSALFNRWLADRVDDGTWRTPLDGDVLLKTENGAPFVCTDPSADGARAVAGDVVVAGPLLGREMRSAERDAMTRESRSWSHLGIDVTALLAHPAFDKGARRAACLHPGELVIDAEGDAVSVRFSLPKGAYASVVLRALFGAGLVDAAFLERAGDGGG